MMAQIDSPIPLSEIESVLTWVDTFNLSRKPTKKINRDFSDAVLLAEMLNLHYPKLVQMHNYPPRNSHSLKLNNWMTLNRKVLKKLKLNLCLNTMEQLSNSAPGVVERVLVMVRDKIRRDEEANKSLKNETINLSSGGSYYEACGDDENILVVPVKTRVNGTLETVQQKVVSYESYCSVKEELKDANTATEILKQKVEHLDSLLKLKEERINELQNQLERKQARKKEVEALQTHLTAPLESPFVINDAIITTPGRTPSLKALDTKMAQETKIKTEEMKQRDEDINIQPTDSKTKVDELKLVMSKTKVDEILKSRKVEDAKKDECFTSLSDMTCNIKVAGSKTRIDELIRTVESRTKLDESRIPILKTNSKPSLNDIKFNSHINRSNIVMNMKYDVPKDSEVRAETCDSNTDHEDEFKDSLSDDTQDDIITIEDTVQKELNNIISPKQGVYNVQDYVLN